VNAQTFTLRDAANQAVAATVSYDAASTTATLTPGVALAAGAAYTATLSTGITDQAGNALTTAVSWSFTTAAGGTGPCPTPCSLWEGTATPSLLADPDTSAVELGMRFQSAVDGQVTGIRFYKGSQNTGTHVGSLWSNTGTLLAQVTFTNETTSGWQEASFPTPVAITANTVYVISYHAPNGRYSVDEGYFSTAYANGPLTAPATSDGGNGVYQYGPGGFPTQTYAGSNYWVDVVFTTP